ncbi:hypothetical protein TIFTF001_049279 [Ficus carica]|uniref:Uncharacterized protein n=1 Tax=Ficus carica TaxID=3494 RepID=A0AA88CR35_FICCA|nr:hypothetical protein TIFTF001_049279 [Ficus carica]
MSNQSLQEVGFSSLNKTLSFAFYTSAFLGIGTSSGVAVGRVWHCSAKTRSSVRLRRCSRLPWRCSANSKGQSTHHHMELQRAGKCGTVAPALRHFCSSLPSDGTAAPALCQ